jgi:hypothetical protein
LKFFVEFLVSFLLSVTGSTSQENVRFPQSCKFDQAYAAHSLCLTIQFPLFRFSVFGVDSLRQGSRSARRESVVGGFLMQQSWLHKAG